MIHGKPKISKRTLRTQIAPKPDIKSLTLIGFIVLFIFVGGFLIWATFFPLESAAIAEGRITVYSHKKVIQHLEGGIAKEIYVREGETVRKGQQLLLIDTMQFIRDTQSINNQILTLVSLEARLVSERDDKSEITFPNPIINNNSKNAQDLITHQKKIFQLRKYNREITKKSLQNKIDELYKEIKILERQAKSADNEITELTTEKNAIAKLTVNKYIELTALMRIKRQIADEVGKKQEVLANISRVKQRINDTTILLSRVDHDFYQDVEHELYKTQDRLTLLYEQLKKAMDAHKRTIIRAPQGGRIVNLHIHTKGAVIKSGETLMDIVPLHDQLIVKAKVNPKDIDVVHKNLKAYIELTSFKSRHTPKLNAIVTMVSADSIEDERTGEHYYAIELKILPDSLNKIPKLKLHPGMPAQVMIITNRQTPLAYFIKPISDSFNRSMRED